MSQLKDERRMKEIFDRGAPYPWDFWESSESGFAGQDYETYWQEEEATKEKQMGYTQVSIAKRIWLEAPTTRNYW